MKKTLCFILFTSSCSVSMIAQSVDWQGVEKVFGKKGTTQSDMLKVTFPRTDLKVAVGDVLVKSGLALTSWAAFKPMSHGVMIMGDLVLLESEIAPAMSALVANGFEISALHNHIVGESPAIKYMHFGGHGESGKLAEALRAVLIQTGTPIGPPQSPTDSTSYDWSKVESILGWNGSRKGKLLQFGIPRNETISENGMEIPAFIGMATAINMQAIDDEKAATTGDFVLIASEVNLVVKTLTENGIAVTAIHNHMLFESPRLFFLHFWGVDKSEKLAHGLKSALDKTNSAREK